jgi:hypothetical protein
MVDKTDVLQFMVIRPPELPAPGTSKTYIRDDYLDDGGLRDADLFSTDSASAIGKLVYTMVFCSDESDVRVSPATYNRNTMILLAALQLLESYEPPCPNLPGANGSGLESASGRSYIKTLDRFLFLPDRIADVNTPVAMLLPEIMAIARKQAAVEDPDDVDLDVLVAEICRILGVKELRAAAFDGAGTSSGFRETKRALFDTLYLLYILRRRFSVSLEQIIDGLRALHLIEALAVDGFLGALSQPPLSATDRPLLNALSRPYPALDRWRPGSPLPYGLPLVAGQQDLLAYLDASPVLHPIFSQLYYYRRPFNPIKPIGVGDLKVVKNWLKAYKVGEIAHIDNVLQGESKTRVHRRLEKTEDVFSYSSEQEQETQRDTQTTDRFEMKRETDSVLKSDTSVNAGLSLNISYEGTGYKILTGITGGFAYSRSQSDQTKTSTNFAREVVDKAVKRVQSRTSQQRTTTKLFETEEANTHTFENKLPGTGHISGIYRWIDKEYEAQLYNFGKRMMFEFIIPEPASFLVESRLRAFEARIEFPRPPSYPQPASLPQWLQAAAPQTIDENRYRQLARQYDLSELPPFPLPTRVYNLVDVKTGNALFAETVKDGNATYAARTYVCKLPGATGYRVTRLLLRGHIVFAGWVFPTPLGPAPTPDDFVPPGVDPTGHANRFDVNVAGDTLLDRADNSTGAWFFTSGNISTSFNVQNTRVLLNDDVTVTLGLWDSSAFSLAMGLELTLDPMSLVAWQEGVLRKVVQVEQHKVDEQNKELLQAYNASMSTYRNRMAEIRATAVNDLLQGQSEAANRQVMLLELKRQCLAMLTKEFDAIQADDQITDYDTMGLRNIRVVSRQFRVDESPSPDFPLNVSGGFETVEKLIPVRLVDIDRARIKGRYIQFLEQAFEWQLLSYFLYPYFWSTPPHWVELMNRSDLTDPFLTSFLQAGSVRVLVAVSPDYDAAVLHYLATGEPWEGGPSPVIGDPLFIPLYQELKRQQDDLAGATPEGKPWQFTLPTSLVYLENSSTPIPVIT